MSVARRFLFVVPPLAGHINPAVGVAAALAGRGHVVAWAGDPDILRRLAGVQATVYPCASRRAGGREVVRPAAIRGPLALRFLWEDYLVPLADAMVPGVAAAVAGFGPDVLVVDQQALAGALVADRLGIAWATSASTSAELAEPLAGLPKVAAWLRRQLDELCRRHGDPALGGDPRFSRELVLAFTTQALAGPLRWPGNARIAFVGPSIDHRAGPSDGRPDLFSGDLPTVFVGMGTVNAGTTGRFLTECAEALRRRNTQLRAVILDPAGVLGPQPDHILVRPHLPQLPVLGGAAAAICHAGHNTVCEALWHGVPLVLAPIRDDQPMVADQVVGAGAGIRLRFPRATSVEIGKAVDAVLADPAYRVAAARIRDSFRAAGGAAAAATELEDLADRVAAPALAAGRPA